jgi:hypothetical protein
MIMGNACEEIYMKRALIPVLMLMTCGQVASASMVADTSLNGAKISCITKGVAPFADHHGGFQFRIDPSISSSSIVSGKFWSIAALMADGLITKTLGTEELNFVVGRDAQGRCAVLLNQVNDQDHNEMDIRIPVTGAKTTATMQLKFAGKAISAEHGTMTCNIDPEFLESNLKPACNAKTSQLPAPAAGPGAGSIR